MAYSKQISEKKRRENSCVCTKSGFARGCWRKTFNKWTRHFHTIILDSFCFKGHCFGGSGYFGVGTPQFFYADMTALTLGKIFRLLGFKFQLPPPVAQTGFPEGASVSSVSSPCYYNYCLFFSLVCTWCHAWSRSAGIYVLSDIDIRLVSLGFKDKLSNE